MKRARQNSESSIDKKKVKTDSKAELTKTDSKEELTKTDLKAELTKTASRKITKDGSRTKTASRAIKKDGSPLLDAKDSDNEDCNSDVDITAIATPEYDISITPYNTPSPSKKDENCNSYFKMQVSSNTPFTLKVYLR